jgi:hypothetical protein
MRFDSKGALHNRTLYRKMFLTATGGSAVFRRASFFAAAKQPAAENAGANGDERRSRDQPNCQLLPIRTHGVKL